MRLANKFFIGIFILFFTFIYSLYSIMRHLRYESLAFDLGIYDQMLWLFSQGKPLYSTLLDNHFFGDHFTPSLTLLTPLFWLWNNVLMLLIFQAFFVTLGAIPIYLLAIKKTKDRTITLVIVFAYLAFFGIQNAIAFDFHPIVLATTLLAWLFYFYEQKKWRWFWPILLLFLGLQENFALVTVALGIYLMIRYRDFKRGLIVALLGGMWFLLTIFLVIPYFNHAQFNYFPNYLKTESLGKIIQLFFYPYSKLKVIAAALSAFAFLPVLSPTIFIFFLEEIGQRFLGSPVLTRWEVGYQYNAILAPILALGAIEAIQKYHFSRKWVVGSLVVSWVITQIWVAPAINRLATKEFYNLKPVKNIQTTLSLIPEKASVAATNNLAPHLTHRQQIILLTNCLKDKTLWRNETKRCFSLKPDYIIATLNDNEVTYFPDSSREAVKEYLDYVIKNKNYHLLIQEGNIYLLKEF